MHPLPDKSKFASSTTVPVLGVYKELVFTASSHSSWKISSSCGKKKLRKCLQLLSKKEMAAETIQQLAKAGMIFNGVDRDKVVESMWEMTAAPPDTIF